MPDSPDGPDSRSPAEIAEARLEAELREKGARDPREFYREQLRELKGIDTAGYQKAVEHYRDRLVPSIASGDAEPLAAWTEYGRTLAELRAPGRTVAIDPTGRSASFSGPMDPRHMVLHLPDEKRTRAILVALPAEPTDAQRATYDWLVAGKLKLPDPAEPQDD